MNRVYTKRAPQHSYERSTTLSTFPPSRDPVPTQAPVNLTFFTFPQTQPKNSLNHHCPTPANGQTLSPQTKTTFNRFNATSTPLPVHSPGTLKVHLSLYTSMPLSSKSRDDSDKYLLYRRGRAANSRRRPKPITTYAEDPKKPT